MKFKVSDNGKVSVRQAESKISKLLEQKCSEWVMHLDGKVLPYGDQSVFEVNFIFTLPELAVVNVDSADYSPTLANCTEMNAVGQRSCLEYLIQEFVSDFYLREYEGYAKFDIYFSPTGKIIALDMTIPARNRQINDSLISRFNSLNSFLTINDKARTEHFNKYYQLTFSYKFFNSSVSERTYIDRVAEDLFSKGDTLEMVEHLILSGMTYRKYSDFKEHCQIFLDKYDLTGDEYLETCVGNFSIDSIINRKVNGNERTSSVMSGRYISAAPESCLDADSITSCTMEYLKAFVAFGLYEKYKLNLTSNIFSHQMGGKFFPTQGYLRFTYHGDGRLVRMCPDIYPAYFRGRNSFYKPVYMVSKEQRHQLSIMFIDVMSELPQFVPSSLDGFSCSDVATVRIRLGEESH